MEGKLVTFIPKYRSCARKETRSGRDEDGEVEKELMMAVDGDEDAKDTLVMEGEKPEKIDCVLEKKVT